ncbi:MAG: YeeE/YedE family protein [Gammaproteobacteria bacterium]|nr:YeeE/YedE family protein [Pseudomonadales bacterium]MCP5345407.1 YeeE/YedE family protein [Pseudomonadales bacterium]
MENFTPLSALLGGALIGIAATLMLWINGRITGISGILGGVLFPVKTDALWRILFILGLFSGALLFMLVRGAPIELAPQASPLLSIVAGLLVGFGTRLGSGCTSGHGICGIARVSKRSFAATLMFMITAVITVFLVRHVLGAGS